MIATIYSTATGAKRCVVQGNKADIELQLGPGEAWIEGEHRGKWINPKTRRPNKLLTMRPKLQGGVIVGLPDGAVARFDGGHEEHPAESGRIDAGEAFQAHLSAPLHTPLTIRIRDDIDALRRAAFPTHGEQLGALVKAVKALMAGEPVPDDALAVIAEVDAAKAAHPKP